MKLITLPKAIIGVLLNCMLSWGKAPFFGLFFGFWFFFPLSLRYCFSCFSIWCYVQKKHIKKPGFIFLFDSAFFVELYI